MKTIRTAEAMRAYAEEVGQAGARLALVPTMGALHEGHSALVRRALREADRVVVSVFVNPTQFGPGEDFGAYPRDLDGDAAKLERLGAHALFAPDEAEMYPGGRSENRTWVEVESLDAHLCGRHRPGHFRGVATVVAKLFNLCRPHVAVFGKKDAQQFVILQRMARDLHFGTEVIGVETQRGAGGLALSSRNAYLSGEERRQAVALSEAVQEAAQRIAEGERRSEALVAAMLRKIAQAPLAEVQYAEVVDAETLQPVAHLQPGREVLAAVAVYFSATRLIDNAFATVPVAVSSAQ